MYVLILLRNLKKKSALKNLKYSNRFLWILCNFPIVQQHSRDVSTLQLCSKYTNRTIINHWKEYCCSGMTNYGQTMEWGTSTWAICVIGSLYVGVIDACSFFKFCLCCCLQTKKKHSFSLSTLFFKVFECKVFFPWFCCCLNCM